MSVRARSVPVVNGVVAAVLVGLLAAVALVAKPSAPPGIGEFAPQAAKPITKAPAQAASTQQSGVGVGKTTATSPATGLGARPAPKPTATAGVPSALQCYTWPDGEVTQTFDPQSPPCIAAWDV